MPPAIKGAFSLLALLFSGAGLFLSSWIIIPAPTFPLLTLGVGAPEVSPWLAVLNATAIALTRVGRHRNRGQRLVVGASLAGLVLSAMPLVQLPATQQRMAAMMVDGLGADYMAQLPGDVQRTMRSHPFVLADAFRGISPSEVRYTPNIQFATRNATPLKLDIYRPPKTGKYPAIVAIYGGAWQRGNPRQNADFNRYMAARGYTVVAIDYRHAPRYRFPAQLEDVRAALTFIHQQAAQYEVDPERIALLGRSAGGHLAMLAAYQPEVLPVRAVVSYYGPFNLTQGYREPPKPDPLHGRA